jgi:hypothetical protein
MINFNFKVSISNYIYNIQSKAANIHQNKLRNTTITTPLAE